jgi:hypothetical protein
VGEGGEYLDGITQNIGHAFVQVVSVLPVTGYISAQFGRKLFPTTTQVSPPQFTHHTPHTTHTPTRREATRIGRVTHLGEGGDGILHESLHSWLPLANVV